METAVITVEVNPKEFGLDEVQGSNIQQAFMPKIVERESLKTMYEQLITKELSAELSSEAGTLRKQLVKVRTGISEIHKTQKAFFLAGGRFADTIKNKETLPIEQMEEKLWEIEKWAEIQEEKRIEKLTYERTEILKQYEIDASLISVGQMSEDIWTKYLSGTKLEFETRKAKEAKDLADKIELERLQAEEREKQRLENIRLKAEAEEKELQLKAEREKAEAEKKAIQDKADADKAKADAEAKKAKSIADKAIADAKAKSDKLAAKLKAKADAEAKVKADAIKAEKLAKAAPDKIKLNKFAEQLNSLEFPELQSEEARLLMSNALNKIREVAKFIVQRTSQL